MGGYANSYSDAQLRPHYDEFARKNEKGFISFDEYKKTANGGGLRTLSKPLPAWLKPIGTRPAQKYEEDFEGNYRRDENGNPIAVYSESDLAKKQADYDAQFFSALGGEMNRQAAQKLGGGSTSTRHAAGSTGDGGEGEGYSERTEGLRKRIKAGANRKAAIQ